MACWLLQLYHRCIYVAAAGLLLEAMTLLEADLCVGVQDLVQHMYLCTPPVLLGALVTVMQPQMLCHMCHETPLLSLPLCITDCWLYRMVCDATAQAQLG
jgi:hypothetical protein